MNKYKLLFGVLFLCHILFSSLAQSGFYVNNGFRKVESLSCYDFDNLSVKVPFNKITGFYRIRLVIVITYKGEKEEFWSYSINGSHIDKMSRGSSFLSATVFKNDELYSAFAKPPYGVYPLDRRDLQYSVDPEKHNNLHLELKVLGGTVSRTVQKWDPGCQCFFEDPVIEEMIVHSEKISLLNQILLTDKKSIRKLKRGDLDLKLDKNCYPISEIDTTAVQNSYNSQTQSAGGGVVIKQQETKSDTALVPYEDINSEGVLRAKGQKRNDIKVGNWVYYYPSGSIHRKHNYDEHGEFHGIQSTWREDAYKEYIESYSHGVKDGPSIRMRSSNDTISVDNYSQGKLHGQSRRYYEGNVLKETTEYKNGKEDGMNKTYSSTGGIDIAATYKDGKRNGSYKRHFRNGNVKEEGAYLNGRKEGKWIFYNQQGKVEKTVTYSKGEVVSE